jgi:hypothetical protein
LGQDNNSLLGLQEKHAAKVLLGLLLVHVQERKKITMLQIYFGTTCLWKDLSKSGSVLGFLENHM